MDYIIYKIFRKLKKYDEGERILGNEEIYLYGVELLLSSLIGFMIIFLEGVMMKIPLESVIFFVSFVALRIYTGGYHSNSYLSCNIIFSICGCCCFYLYKSFTVHITVFVCTILCLVNALLIMKCAPIVHVNKPLDEERKKKCRKRGMIVLVIEFMILCISCGMNFAPGKIILLSILLVDVLMIIVKGKIYYEEKRCRKNINGYRKNS